MSNDLFFRLKQEVAELDHNTLDILASPSSISARDDGTLFIGRKDELELTPAALKQLTQHFNIPHEYFAGCPPHLRAANLNHWLELSTESTWAVRISASRVLGFNFNGHIPFGRSQLVTILTLMEAKHPFDTLSYKLNTDNLDVRLYFPGEQHCVGTLKNGDLDLVCPGLHLQCREVGNYVLSLHGLVHRLVCKNGLLPPPREVYLRHYTSAHNEDLVDLLEEDLESALVVASESIRRMRHAIHVKIDDPVGYIVAKATQRFTRDFAREAVKAYSSEGADSTLYCIINAFTRAAQRYPVHERLLIESFAGELLAS